MLFWNGLLFYFGGCNKTLIKSYVWYIFKSIYHFAFVGFENPSQFCTYATWFDLKLSNIRYYEYNLYSSPNYENIYNDSLFKGKMA